jgi:hypothetical protein
VTSKLKEISAKAKASLKKLASHEDTKAAAKWTKETSIAAGSKAKKFSKTELGKQMLIPATIGALIAIPIPVVGPIFGGLAGSAWGYYNYMSKRRSVDIDGTEAETKSSAQSAGNKDIYAEIAKLDLLRRSGTLSEDEFTAAKKALLKNA